MKRWTLLLLAPFVLCFASCTRNENEVPIEVIRMREKLVSAEKELAALEERMKDPTIESGLKDRLAGERELMKSRIERIRENLDERDKKTPH